MTAALNVVEKPITILTTFNRDYFLGSCILCLKMVNSEAKNGNSLEHLQMSINHKALNLLLSSFRPFLFQGSGGNEIPTDDCTLQTAGHCLW